MSNSDHLDIKSRPEQEFFDDPAIDRAMGIVLALATELYVERDRRRALERLLQDAGVVDISSLDRAPTQEEVLGSRSELESFVRGLMDNVLGRQASSGPVYRGNRFRY